MLKKQILAFATVVCLALGALPCVAGGVACVTPPTMIIDPSTFGDQEYIASEDVPPSAVMTRLYKRAPMDPNRSLSFGSTRRVSPYQAMLNKFDEKMEYHNNGKSQAEYTDPFLSDIHRYKEMKWGSRGAGAIALNPKVIGENLRRSRKKVANIGVEPAKSRAVINKAFWEELDRAREAREASIPKAPGGSGGSAQPGLRRKNSTDQGRRPSSSSQGVRMHKRSPMDQSQSSQTATASPYKNDGSVPSEEEMKIWFGKKIDDHAKAAQETVGSTQQGHKDKQEKWGYRGMGVDLHIPKVIASQLTYYTRKVNDAEQGKVMSQKAKDHAIINKHFWQGLSDQIDGHSTSVGPQINQLGGITGGKRMGPSSQAEPRISRKKTGR